MSTDPLKLFRPLGKRAAKMRKRSLAALGATADKGLPASTSVQNGFIIRSNIIDDDLHRVIVIPPPGIVTVFSTYHGTFLYANDSYKGPVDVKKDLSTFDYVLKRYAETGMGNGDYYFLLLQGQSENTVLYNYPYSNMNYAQFVRNGSWYNTEPIGNITPFSYQYPDSWPTPGLFPSGAEDSVWLSLGGTDLVYNLTVNQCAHHETTKISYDSSNTSLDKKTMVSDQKLSYWRPTVTAFPLPVEQGYKEVRAVTYMSYPFHDGVRYLGTKVDFSEGVLLYRRINLEEILHDPDSVPDSHTGPVMPATLRDLVLQDASCSCRPNNFYAFCGNPGEEPVIFSIIDITDTEQLQHPNGPDADYLEGETENKKWRISCHWLDTGTGETWSFTADQFWDLLRERVRNVEIQEDWESAPSESFLSTGWHAALAVLNQWFGRPQHNFQVPHDTWTFHAADGNIYCWSRYYGSIKIDKFGIHGLSSSELIVPQPSIETDGVRPTIRYSGKSKEGIDRYICVCEKLERLTTEEDNQQGKKEVIGMYFGSPFVDGGWVQFGQLEIEKEDEIWTLCHARIAYHYVSDDNSDNIMILGIIRRKYFNEDTEEYTISYHSAYLNYNSFLGGAWVVTGKYNGLNTEDPIYGERWSADISVFGDSNISKKIMRYPSQPAVASQQPYGPYESYYNGLP